MSSTTGLRTPSLRRRVTVVVLTLIGVMLVVLAVVTDLVLGSRLDAQLRQRLVDRAAVASALVGQVEGSDLARRLEGDGVSVTVRTSTGRVYAAGPLADATTGSPDPALPSPPGEGPGGGPAPRTPPRPAGEVVQEGDLLSVTRSLDDGSSVQLFADARDVNDTLGQVRLALVVGALLVLLVAALTVPLVVARALRPLDRITEVARSITRGDRQRRLDPQQPASELGRTAVAFDEMLDEVVGAEQRALGSEHRLRDFLSDAAHELRTPLTGVQAAAEHLLREDPARPEREEVLTGLIRQSRRAGRLVDDMLLMARIDRGLELEDADLMSLDLRELAEQVAGDRTLTRSRARIMVTGVAGTVSADRDRLAQVVGNLVDNALRATRGSGRIEMQVSGSTDVPAQPVVLLDVRDDGPGVPEAERERIFERLVRLDQARNAQDAGAGLGLPIARGIARAHGGDLACLPAEHGAWFRLTLPAAGHP